MHEIAWSTAAAGRAGRSPVAELEGLGDHLALCRALNGRWFALQCGGEVVRTFLAAHLVTTLLIGLLLAAGIGLLR
jgi:hypothetical protein